MTPKPSILVATLGTEPQVVTLVLDKLLQEGEAVTRVTVVHTDDKDPTIGKALEALRHEFLTKRYYGNRLLFDLHVLAGSGGPLRDVTTPEEIDFAFEGVYSLLRQHKYAGHKIHLSIAGGRKTMALFAMAAAQILFDSDDRVWHLVSRASLVASRQLHTEEAEDAVLVPVPIANWRNLQPSDTTRVRDFIDNVLTPVEREIVMLLVQKGLSNQALADYLNKSVKTIANQFTMIYSKLADHFDLTEVPDRTMLLVLLGKNS